MHRIFNCLCGWFISHPWNNTCILKDIITSADVSFTNAEMLFHNYEDAPSTVPGGTYMRCDPQYIEDLKWMGFDIVATANNHAWDFGENGVLTNIQNLT